MRSVSTIWLLVWLSTLSAGTSAAAIDQVDLSTLTHLTNLREFGDGGDYGSSVVNTGERFLGQTIVLGGPVAARPNEILTGQPTNPLTLTTRPGREGVCSTILNDERGIAGLIADDQGTQLSCGEGSVAFLFAEDQSEIGIRLGNKPITLQFFARDGAPLGVFNFNEAAGTEVGFLRTGGAVDIAGFTFHNEGSGGTALLALYFGAKPPVEIFSNGGFTQECVSEGGSEIEFSAELGVTPDPVISIEWKLDGESEGFGSNLPIFIPLGQHQVVAEATTDTGEVFSDSKLVEVVDTTPPTVSVVLRDRFGNQISTVQPGLNRLTVDSTASDICDPAPVVNAEGTFALGEDGTLIVQPTNRRIAAEAEAISVRATAVDTSGNTAEASATLTIP